MWKDAPSTPLCGVALTKIIIDVLEKNHVSKAILTLCIGEADIGSALVEDKRFPLISFTGSTAVGKIVSQKVS